MSDEHTCQQWTARGRCRNKVADNAPHKHRWSPTTALCKRHADSEARRILAENEQLVWALRRLGLI